MQRIKSLSGNARNVSEPTTRFYHLVGFHLLAAVETVIWDSLDSHSPTPAPPKQSHDNRD